MNRTWLEILAEDLVLCPPCEGKMIAEKERLLKLTVEEVRSIVEEMKNQFISRDNPKCEATLYRMIHFLEEMDNARPSQDH